MPISNCLCDVLLYFLAMSVWLVFLEEGLGMLGPSFLVYLQLFMVFRTASCPEMSFSPSFFLRSANIGDGLVPGFLTNCLLREPLPSA